MWFINKRDRDMFIMMELVSRFKSMSVELIFNASDKDDNPDKLKLLQIVEGLGCGKHF